MSQAMAKPVSVQRIVEESWRFEPHLYAAHVSGGTWKMYRWLKFLGEAIRDTVLKPRGRLIVNAPPRHGKSELVSHWLPVWYLHLWPERRIILGSYGADLAKDMGRKVRNEFAWNPLVGGSLAQDSKRVSRWHTPQGGGMMTVGVDGSVTGFGGDLIIIDDPMKNWAESQSYEKRKACDDWFTGTLYDRAQPDATIIVGTQRWHEDDLCGMLIEHHSDDWTVLRMPALAEDNDPIGREPGQALWPEAYGAVVLDKTRLAVGERKWLAKFQQRPKALGAGRVYCKFDSAINVDQSIVLRDDLPLQLSLDFNIAPGMHGVIGQWDKDGDCFSAVHEIYRLDLPVDGFLHTFLEWVQRQGGFRWPELHVFGDVSGKARNVNTGESSWHLVARALRAAGLPYRQRVPSGSPPLRDSIDAFNDALCDMDGACHYVVHPRCVRLVTDFKDLRADEHGLTDKRDDSLSHASDAERYRVHYLRPLSFSIPEQTGGRFIFA